LPSEAAIDAHTSKVPGQELNGIFSPIGDGRFDGLPMLVHPLKSAHHRLEQNLGQLCIDAALGHALDQGALIEDPPFGELDVPQRLRQMVSLESHNNIVSAISRGVPAAEPLRSMHDRARYFFVCPVSAGAGTKYDLRAWLVESER
jgi:hypothetical protein